MAEKDRPYEHHSEAELFERRRQLERDDRYWIGRHTHAFDVGATDEIDSALAMMRGITETQSAIAAELRLRREERAGIQAAPPPSASRATAATAQSPPPPDPRWLLASLLASVHDWFQRVGLPVPAEASLEQEIRPSGIPMISWRLSEVFCIATSSPFDVAVSVPSKDLVSVNTKEELAAALLLCGHRLDDLIPKPPRPKAPVPSPEPVVNRLKRLALQAIAEWQAQLDLHVHSRHPIVWSDKNQSDGRIAGRREVDGIRYFMIFDKIAGLEVYIFIGENNVIPANTREQLDIGLNLIRQTKMG